MRSLTVFRVKRNSGTHEALDRLLAGTVGIMEPARYLPLIVEGQPFLGPPGHDVEMAAHRPQKALGPLELAHLGLREQSGLDQAGAAVEPVEILADPEQGVEVAEAALAFLDVGLDDIAAVAHPPVAFVALVQLLLGEGADIAGIDLLPEPRLDLVAELLVAPDVERFEDGGADRGRPLRTSSLMLRVE